jgi:hypothetical protein
MVREQLGLAVVMAIAGCAAPGNSPMSSAPPPPNAIAQSAAPVAAAGRLDVESDESAFSFEIPRNWQRLPPPPSKGLMTGIARVTDSTGLLSCFELKIHPQGKPDVAADAAKVRAELQQSGQFVWSRFLNSFSDVEFTEASTQDINGWPFYKVNVNYTLQNGNKAHMKGVATLIGIDLYTFQCMILRQQYSAVSQQNEELFLSSIRRKTGA